MADQTKGGGTQSAGVRVLDAGGQDMTRQVGKIQMGDLSKALGDLSDEDVKALRGGGGSARMRERSSKEIVITQGGADDMSYPDADF